ncbi:MAG: hypothetical protein ABIT37_18180 [Luteolibacter sp.]
MDAILLAGMLSVVGVIVWAIQPVVIRSHRNSELTEAINNARQIGFALFEFDTEYGRFPDATTTSPVRRKAGTLLPLGVKTSNDFFRQLIASGLVVSERMFFAKIAGAREADNWIEGAHALEKGECGFAYLAGLSIQGNPGRPVVVTPLIPGTDRFDRTKFDGRAVILKIDNSVTSVPIDRDGHVMMFGKNLLDPTNPIWGEGDKFTIAWPE